MPRIPVDSLAPAREVIARAAELLRRGALVAFPTETVYGLGANALDPAAVRRIFEAKGRPSYNPLIAHVADASAARALTTGWSDIASRAADAFWPGPLTLVLRKHPRVPDEMTAGRSTVAVRVPAHPVALALLRAAGTPIAAPSANRFTEVSPTTAEHVEKALGDRVEMILDAGPTEVGIESTVLDLTGEHPVLLRPGLLSREALSSVLGPVELPDTDLLGNSPRPAPGMVERHYAPRATLRLFDSEDRAAVTEWLTRASDRGERVGAIVSDGPSLHLDREVRLPAEPAGYARSLYAALHALDDQGCDLVVVQQVPSTPEWAGIRDRLRRAAHGR